MQYTTDYVVNIIHHQTELQFERDLERRRIARERAAEQRAAVWADGAQLAADGSRGQHSLVTRMPWAGLVRRLRSVKPPVADPPLPRASKRQPKRELAHR
jgi:hypothetical protein